MDQPQSSSKSGYKAATWILVGFIVLLLILFLALVSINLANESMGKAMLLQREDKLYLAVDPGSGAVGFTPFNRAATIFSEDKVGNLTTTAPATTVSTTNAKGAVSRTDTTFYIDASGIAKPMPTLTVDEKGIMQEPTLLPSALTKSTDGSYSLVLSSGSVATTTKLSKARPPLCL